MALATQCPHCFTIFRVAGDQLKLRGGLVRCGSCRQVFNGEEYLVEASVADGHYQPAPGSKARFGSAVTSAPALPVAPVNIASAIPDVNTTVIPPGTPDAVAAAPTPPPVAEVASRTEADAPVSLAPPIPAIPEPKVFRSPSSPGYIPDLGAPLKEPDWEQQPQVTTPEDDLNTAALLRRSSADTTSADDTARDGGHGDGRIEPGFGDDDDAPSIGRHLPASPYFSADQREGDASGGDDRAQRDGSAKTDDIDAEGDTADTGTGAQADEPGEEEKEEDEEDDDPADAPAFVKRAERQERVGHVLKMAMMILAGVMVPILLLQATYYWRNQLAVAVPPLRPMLNGMCNAFHCNVGLPAEIERLTLESNELQVVPPNQNIYALALVLRNRGAGPQAWPHIELTLNNDDEKAVVRRVFRPREYLASPQLLEAGIAGESEQQVKLTFELNEAVVSGYRIYLFYP